MPYDFNYGVADPLTGADFGHTETSDGGAVAGSYHVLLPDGRRQIVTYTADAVNGFVANVSKYNQYNHFMKYSSFIRFIISIIRTNNPFKMPDLLILLDLVHLKY